MPYVLDPELKKYATLDQWRKLEALQEHGTFRAAAKALGCHSKGISRAKKSVLEKARRAETEKSEPQFHGVIQAPHTPEFDVPKRGVKRYILTSAQNNTMLHENLWRNLLAFADHHKAKLMVARYTYMKHSLGASGDKALFTHIKNSETFNRDELAWAPELDPYLADERIEIAPGLVWCGEWQRLPTTKRPLSGYETYTGRNSGIFPHAKFEMQSVASMKSEATKFNFTTGTVTMRNYIVKGAGLQATFHHGYGAVIVEVDSTGDWWVRQINADSDGNFYDLDVEVRDGVVTTGVPSVEGVTFGDIHVQERSLVIDESQETLLDYFKPKYAFYHDVLNFGSRNHHERRDPFKLLERHVEGQEDVCQEVECTMRYLYDRAYIFDDTTHIVVDSNHDRALERWLKEGDWRTDPINMEFFLESALAKVRAVMDRNDRFHMMQHWYREVTKESAPLPNVKFLDEDESFVLCEDANGGIECGMHGHLGPNGARGGAAAFAKMGRKANVGHSHQAGIYDGIYTAGTSSNLDLGYNRGPSSWSHSDVLTYRNGKRTIITHWHGKWHANMKPVSAYLK